jgi:hypothetical protein
VSIETWELWSYIVTTIGLPVAIFVFVYEQKKERDNEEDEVYQLLSDNYQDFLKVALANPDLRLFTTEGSSQLTPEQRERMMIIFDMLVSLFERAYLSLYEPRMSSRQRRRWSSWEDYMREWCQRNDFRASRRSCSSARIPSSAHTSWRSRGTASARRPGVRIEV